MKIVGSFDFIFFPRGFLTREASHRFYAIPENSLTRKEDRFVVQFKLRGRGQFKLNYEAESDIL